MSGTKHHRRPAHPASHPAPSPFNENSSASDIANYTRREGSAYGDAAARIGQAEMAEEARLAQQGKTGCAPDGSYQRSSQAVFGALLMMNDIKKKYKLSLKKDVDPDDVVSNIYPRCNYDFGSEGRAHQNSRIIPPRNVRNAKLDRQ